MAVSPAERAMVDLAVALVDGSDVRLQAPRMAAEGEATGLSGEALAALQRVLSRGVGRWVATGGAPRPWRQAPPPSFGSATLDLLHWLHTTKVGDAERPALTLRAPLTAGEVPLLCRAVAMVHAVGGPPPEPAVRSPWCWLFAGELLASGARVPPDLPWAEVIAADGWLLDTQQRRLKTVHRDWCRATRAADVPTTTALGQAQQAVLTGLLTACVAQAERVGFLAELATELAALPDGVWAVDRHRAALSHWQRARQAAVALPRVLVEHWVPWGDRWRATGFVDDDYEEAQRWLSRYDAALRAAASMRDVVARTAELPEVA